MGKLGSRIKILLCSLLLVMLATGCWGRRETDEMAYILAMGIDPGQENIVRITFQLAIPSGLAGKGGGDKSTEVITVEAASIFGALQLANSFVSKELTLIHNEIVIISAEIAQQGLETFINPLLRSREIRRNTTIAIAQGKAEDFLKNNQDIFEKNPSSQFELFLETKKRTGFIFTSSLNGFSMRDKSPGSNPVLTLLGSTKEKQEQTGSKKDYAELVRSEVAYIPGEVPRVGGNRIEIIGLAAFKGDRLVGFLNGNETRYYQMLANTYQSAILTFPDPNQEEKVIIIKVIKGRSPEYSVDLSGDRPLIKTVLIMEGEILSIQSGINYEESGQQKILEKYVEDYITAEAQKLVKKTQQDFQSDIIGFGEETRKKFWTWQDWVQYGWLEKYPRADIEVSTSMEIRRTGLMLRTAVPTKEAAE